MLRIMLKHLSKSLKRLSGSEAMNVHPNTDRQARRAFLVVDFQGLIFALEPKFSHHSFPGTTFGSNVSQSIQRRKS